MNYLDEINYIKKLISSGEKKDKELADKLLNKIYSLNPQDFFLENFYGAFLALDNNEINTAIKKFENSIKLNKEFSEPYYNLGRIYFAKQNYLESEFFLKQAITLDIYNLHYKNLLGQIYLKLHKYDEAIYIFNIIRLFLIIFTKFVLQLLIRKITNTKLIENNLISIT